MEFRILGPLELLVDGRTVPLPGRIQPRLLAALLLEPGRALPLSGLIKAIWDDDPPDTARRQVQNAVSALRKVLCDRRVLESVGDGYRLDTAGSTVDSVRFGELLRRARGADDGHGGLALLVEALDLWRGDALSGLPGRTLEAAARRLDEARSAARADRIELELRLRPRPDVIEELRELLDRDPYQQRVAGLLMLALYRGGGAAEAVALYQRMRARLADRLGIDPGPALRGRYTAILREDPSLDCAETTAGPDGAHLRFSILGPLEVRRFDGRALVVRGRGQRRLLAELLLAAGQVCTFSGLAGALWDGEPPPDAQRRVRHEVVRLRAQLGDAEGDVIETVATGFQLRVGDGCLDARVFANEELRARRERSRGNLYGAAEALTRGLDLWRGSFLAGMNGPSIDAAASSWTRSRLAAVEALRELRAALLRADPRLPVEPADTSAVPSQLPATLAAFTGRRAQLDELDRAAAGTDAVLLLSGMAGVGKTTLAVRWAHRAADRFPDGRLYLNLRGFGSESSVVEPAQALRACLDAFGVASGRIPADLDARAALYRSTLAGKRALIILDNARDAAQVRPLLPGTAGCHTIITSRNAMPGLIATDGARPVSVDLLDDEESRELLRRRIGPERVSAEPAAVERLVAFCAGLPLALAVVGARALVRSDMDLDAVASELHAARTRLDAFSSDDESTDLRAVFSWSYKALDHDAARLFRLLGVHAGPDIAAAAAVSLAGTSWAHVRPSLAALVRAQLVTEPVPGRYGFHDLLRAFAVELTEELDTADQRHEAAHRSLDHYLHTSHAAFRLIAPTVETIDLTEPRPGVIPEDFEDKDQALAWFRRERPVLLNAIAHAEALGAHTYTWQLTWTVRDFLGFDWHVDDLTVALRRFLRAGHHLGDPWVRMTGHRNLAVAQMRALDFEAAEHNLTSALELAERHRGAADTALILRSICQLHGKQGRYAEAVEYGHRALRLAEESGDRWGQATGLNNLGWYYTEMGRYPQAIASAERALALCDGPGSAERRALIRDTLGYAERHLGRYQEAVVHHQESIALSREVGNRTNEAFAWEHLGDDHRDAGDTEAALRAWHTALNHYSELGHSAAAPVREKIGRTIDASTTLRGT